jgi:gliding motility-associated-like protein
MKKLPLISVLLILPFFLQAQKQNSIWYFGNGAGTNFNTTPPSSLTDGALNAAEGCASVSDDNGNLLFYTDGMTVFNKQHQVMAGGTGLSGHKSSTQGVVIVPWPGRTNLFLIFTADAVDRGGALGYTYSVVDISRNGGLGEVIQKNQLVYAPSTEKLTIAKHCNGTDWWVITKPHRLDEFHCYMVDVNGVNATPIISFIPSPLPGVSYDAVGCIKVSPNGQKLALAAYDGSYFQLSDFNSSTGVITNTVTINSVAPYGVEFSPDSRLLYLTSDFANEIVQFDLTSYTDATSLEATRIVVTPVNYPKSPMGLQLGPDNRLYISTKPTGGSIDVIEFPNQRGTACSFIMNGIDLNGRKGGLMFPQLIPNSSMTSTTGFTVDIQIDVLEACQRLVQLKPISNQNNVQYEWKFDDGSTSTIERPQRKYNAAKDAFDIELKAMATIASCSQNQPQIKTITKTITFNPLPIANAGKDMAVVAGTPFELSGSGGIQYEWSPVQYLNNPTLANPTAIILADQPFKLKVSNADGCTAEDQVQVKVYKRAELYVPSAFTPNSDGKNDIVHALPVGIQLQRFTIYNRWGNVVFSATNPAKGWDGYYKTKLQPAGIYVWTAEGIDSSGKTTQYKGTVYLMR